MSDIIVQIQLPIRLWCTRCTWLPQPGISSGLQTNQTCSVPYMPNIT